MSVIFKRTFIRPYEDIEFWSAPEEFVAHMKTNYIDTGKCIRFRDVTLTDSSGLVAEIVSEWTDEAVAEILNGEETLTPEVLEAFDPTWASYRAVETSYNEECEIVNLRIELG